MNARLERFLAVAILAFAVVAVALGAGPATPPARADGDPGSDVLVYQNYFVDWDSGLSDPQQVALGDMLTAAAKRGFPIRVAIIAHPDDLGAITGAWLKPQAYAAFLGVELSDAYKQRLLVVMPNGFGFNWPGHTTTAEYRLLNGLAVGKPGTPMLTSTFAALRALAHASGVTLPAVLPAGGAGASVPEGNPVPAIGGGATGAAAPAAGSQLAASGQGAGGSSSGSSSGSSGGTGADNTVATVFFALLVIGGLAYGVARLARRGSPISVGPRWLMPAMAAGAMVLLIGTVLVSIESNSSSTTPTTPEIALADNPNLDPGTALGGRTAPDFTLIDQDGQAVSLRSFRGKVVLLDFNDSECTTICPLTTTALLDAKRALGPAASRVELLGVDADPKAIAIDDVLSYTQLHGLSGQWDYVTGTLPQLRQVWRDYGIGVDITRGLISHTPALFVIDPQGRMRKVYITQSSYAAVGQFGQELAHEVAGLLPNHPRVSSSYTYAEIKGVSPTVRVSVPRAGGGTVALGPSAAPRLYVFFATWDQEVTGLAGELDALNRYSAAATRSGLPALTAVDEGSVEPSSAALPSFLKGLPQQLHYPVGVDETGRIADGYEVQGQPWFVLTSPTGKILWYWEVYTAGFPSVTKLQQDVRTALAHESSEPTGVQADQRLLASSPPALASLHTQANRLLGWDSAFKARVASLRGYPIVVNAWASWCENCQAEYPLFRNASLQFGRRVAFIGVDTEDSSSSDARLFMSEHWLSYPSYQSLTETGLESFLPGGLLGLPTTFYINRAGKVTNIHTGAYASQGTLDSDIEQYALGG